MSESHSVFAYPGNKSGFAAWIIERFPAHQCYVEPFGGAAGVLANKPPSHNEIYNDVDGDLVQFFDTLRDRGADLVEWLRQVPYARQKYDVWVEPWYADDWRPDDPVERAGVFFYLRQTSFGGTYQYPGGFATSSTRNQARTFAGQVERLEAFAERFREVTIENLDWAAVVEKYDSPSTLFYLDPPYYANRCRYRHGHDFDHAGIASVLEDVDGEWAVSYGELPPEIEALAATVAERPIRYNMGSGYNGEGKPSVERLATSYDPDRVRSFVDAQHRLGHFGGDGG